MEIETTEFSTFTDVYLNLSTTTDSMQMETTESSETLENNNTITLNISLDFEIELSFDDEFFGKMFDFFAHKMINDRIDKIMEITKFVAEYIGPSIGTLMKKQIIKKAIKSLDKKKQKKVDYEEFEELEELFETIPDECPACPAPCEAYIEVSDDVCLEWYDCKIELLKCLYDIWDKQNMPNFWHPPGS